MKPQRFNGATIQKVLTKIHEELGTEALIYSTQTLPGGDIEVLAGLPVVITEPEIFPSVEIAPLDNVITPEHLIIENLNAQLRVMDEKIKQMTVQLNKPFMDVSLTSNDEIIKNNNVMYYLRKLGFRGDFCQQFTREYLASRRGSFTILNEEDIENALLNYLKVPDEEVIDKQNIITLVGPTGVGKTTTIAKLAKRYIAKYGSRSVGLITTDYCDIASKNQLSYYSHVLNIPLEYANNPQELTLALHELRDKDFILIDTYGVSQRDNDNLNELRSFLESHGNKITTYITLPCNVQEPILDEIARGFRTTNFGGCILTKQDESISMAPALSICMLYNMPVAYFCMGQNIFTDIHKASAGILLHQIIRDSIITKDSAEIDLFQNVQRVANNINEGKYDRQSSC
jgi:flagellar biosynthesis protein FlhF